jgi:hypothetical protein
MMSWPHPTSVCVHRLSSADFSRSQLDWNCRLITRPTMGDEHGASPFGPIVRAARAELG